MSCLREHWPLTPLDQLSPDLQRYRSRAKHDALKSLRDFVKRVAMIALACVYHGGLWETYWKSERAAA